MPHKVNINKHRTSWRYVSRASVVLLTVSLLSIRELSTVTIPPTDRLICGDHEIVLRATLLSFLFAGKPSSIAHLKVISDGAPAPPRARPLAARRRAPGESCELEGASMRASSAAPTAAPRRETLCFALGKRRNAPRRQGVHTFLSQCLGRMVTRIDAHDGGTG